MSKFKDPYEFLPERERHRTTIDVGGKDKSFLVSCHNRRGTVQVTLNILMSKLIEQLKANGITDYDPERYESAVAGCHIVLAVADRVVTNPNPTGDGKAAADNVNNPRPEQTACGNDGRGTVPVACVPQANTPPAPDTNRAPESKRSTGSKRKVPVKRQVSHD
jgi:hypothetical protein